MLHVFVVERSQQTKILQHHKVHHSFPRRRRSPANGSQPAAVQHHTRWWPVWQVFWGDTGLLDNQCQSVSDVIGLPHVRRVAGWIHGPHRPLPDAKLSGSVLILKLINVSHLLNASLAFCDKRLRLINTLFKNSFIKWLNQCPLEQQGKTNGKITPLPDH